MADLLAKQIQQTTQQSGVGRDLLAKSSQESSGFLSSLVSPFKTFGRGVAGAGEILREGIAYGQQEEALRRSSELIEQAKSFPVGSQRRTALLEQAQKVSSNSVKESTKRLETLEKAPTPRQMLGATAQVIGTLAPAGKAVQLGRLGLAGRVGSAALTGAKAGAISGGITGLGAGIAEGKTVDDTIISSLEGALFGWATGAVLGGVLGGASGTARRLLGKAETTIDDALDITNPTIRKKATIKAFERAGKPGGVKEEGRLFKRYVIEPERRQREVAESVKNLVNKRNSPVRNIANITNEIERVSETEIRPFLQQNPAAFNKNQFRAFMKRNIDIPKLFKADPVMERTYNSVIDTALEVIDDAPKTMEGAWDARKVFDQIIDQQFGDAIYNQQNPLSSPIKRAVIDARRVWNDFIAQSIPKGKIGFSSKLKNLSNMYEARHNIAEQNWRLVNSTAFARWKSQNPGKWLAIKLGVTSTATGGLLSRFF